MVISVVDQCNVYAVCLCIICEKAVSISYSLYTSMELNVEKGLVVAMLVKVGPFLELVAKQHP